MLSPTHLRREGEDYEAQILSKAVKAGRRTYFFDVRATRGDDYFLTITESRKMTDAVLSMAEYNRFSKGIFSWVGFKTKWFDYENIERVAGTTKWNFWGLFKYSIEGIVGFSTTPLLIAAGVGVLFCILAFIGIIFVIVRALMFGDPTSGWPSMVCIILLCSGVQLFCTGIVGEYLAKTYLEVKHRPIYIVAETEEDKK